MTSTAAPALPSDAVSVSANALAVGDGIWIDNGGCAGAGRIVELSIGEKPTGYKVYDLVIERPDGQRISKRVTAMHKGLYKAASLAR